MFSLVLVTSTRRFSEVAIALFDSSPALTYDLRKSNDIIYIKTLKQIEGLSTGPIQLLSV